MSNWSTISNETLASVPRRRSRKQVVVLKFGGTTMGATREQGRIRLARDTIARMIAEDKFVVPVFSAYRRGRSGSQGKFSVTDLLHNYKSYVSRSDTLADGVEAFGKEIFDAHRQLIADLNLEEDSDLAAEIEYDVRMLKNTVAIGCSAFEPSPSLDDAILTTGERLAVKVMAAYLNYHHREGKFPMQAAPVTALELGIYTDNRFGSASIDWALAVDHCREVIVGQYLERNIVPIVTGFDGIYDPNREFEDIMQSDRSERFDERYANVYRTSLGRGGSDLTATFLGLALEAEYVGFCKETPGVLTGDDMLIGDAARTVHQLNYELATEAGNIYSRAVEPVRAGSVPVHIFDPANPDERTVISDIELPTGLYIVERPIEAVNIHVGTIPDEPGSLIEFLELFAKHSVNVEEIRHQRSGTDCIVLGEEATVQKVVDRLHERGLRPSAHRTWYLRVVGNVTEELASQFNEFIKEFDPLTCAAFQIGTRVLTTTVARNRAGDQLDEMERVEQIVCRIHNELVVPTFEPTEPSVP